PAVNGYFFIPVAGQCLAALAFDDTGTTRIGKYVLNHSFMRPGKNNVDVIKGFARFVDAKTIEVNGETITADHILIATGGRPSH
ncbi:hypothetical protein KU710_22765, partial [Salmonella enterica subsp. enterica serovar Give]|nr:hypothetical protein [Salmonella enterica subsp. enterica serovar Give]